MFDLPKKRKTIPFSNFISTKPQPRFYKVIKIKQLQATAFIDLETILENGFESYVAIKTLLSIFSPIAKNNKIKTRIKEVTTKQQESGFLLNASGYIQLFKLLLVLLNYLTEVIKYARRRAGNQ